MDRSRGIEKLCGSRLAREPEDPPHGRARIFGARGAAARSPGVSVSCAPRGARARDALPTAGPPAHRPGPGLLAPAGCVSPCTPRRSVLGCRPRRTRARGPLGATPAPAEGPMATDLCPRSTLRVVFGMGEFPARSMCSPSRTGLHGGDVRPGTGRACRVPRACAEHRNAHPRAPRITVWAGRAPVNSAEPVDRAGVIDPRNRVALTRLAFGSGPLPDRA